MRTGMRLGLAAGLGLAIGFGCGGPGESVDDATVIVTEPGAVSVTAPTPGAAAPTSPAAAPSAATTPAPGAAAPVQAAGFGTLKGRVTFGGAAPAPRILVAKGDTKVKDPAVCAVEPIPSQRLVVDPQTKGVRYAIVYIPKPTAVSPEAESDAKSAVVDFDQKGCLFEPHVMAAMKGSKVELKSSDPVGHNINSQLINTKFNISVPAATGGEPSVIPVTLGKQNESRPGPVVCDIHPWMKAWWYVAGNPYFAVTNEQGEYEIANAPAGTQKVVVWAEAVHPKLVTASSGDPVVIEADGETVKDFVIDPKAVKPES